MITKRKAGDAGNPAAEADPFRHVGDPHWGQGGDYRIDPATGQRVPATPEPQAAAAEPNQE